MDFYFERTQKAAKPHKCAGCKKLICVGDRYLYLLGKSEGVFGSWSYHEDCREFEIELNLQAFIYPDEWTLLHEHVENEGTQILGDAPPAVQARFCRP